MAGEWTQFAFSKLCDITRGASPRPIHDWFAESGIPWVKISDANSAQSRYITETGQYIKPEGRHRSVEVRPGDLILSNSATPGIPKFMGISACIHDGWLLLRNLRNLDKQFAYYLLLHERPKLVAQGNGSVFTNLKTEILKNHLVNVPPLPEQRAIAHILGTLDDKIELNRRRNQTLEAMARALFKDWFVDFGPVRAKMEGREPYLPTELWQLFPDRLDDEGKPEGWRSATLANFASLNPESWTKKNAPHEIRYVDLSNTKQGAIEGAARMPWSEAPSRAQRILRIGDTIVGTVRPGNESFALIADQGMTGSTGFAVLRPQEKYFREFVFLAATSPENIERLSHLADGATYPAVRPDVVLASPVTVPPGEIVNDVLRGFANAVSGGVDAVEQNKQESQTLAQLRDTLLPKLISGELRIPDAVTFMERVA